VEVIGQKRDEVAEHMAGTRKAVQQQQLRCILRAGLTIEDLEAVDIDLPKIDSAHGGQAATVSRRAPCSFSAKPCSLGSFVFGTPGFPLSDVPLHEIAADAAAGRLDVKPVRVFGFDEIREVHRVMEANEARGKMVVVHD
jgi:hypothetical protein